MADNKINVIVALKDKASRGAKKLNKSFAALGKTIKNVAKVGVAAFTAALGLSIRNAGIQQAAIDELNGAMQNNGTYTEAASKAAQDYASALQTQSTYGDEAIISAQSLLVRLGKLSGEGLKKATKATLDLAAATGMDLKGAANLVGKSVGSSTNALSRYGVEVNGAVGSVERLNSFVENSAEIFGGAALAKTQGFTGQLTQLKNAFGDVTEQIGFALIPMLQNDLIPMLMTGTKALSKFLSVERIATWTKDFKIGLGSVKLALGLTADYLSITARTVISGFQTIFEAIEIGVLRLKSWLPGASKDISNQIVAIQEEQHQRINKLDEDGKAVLGTRLKEFLKISSDAEAEFEAKKIEQTQLTVTKKLAIKAETNAKSLELDAGLVAAEAAAKEKRDAAILAQDEKQTEAKFNACKKANEAKLAEETRAKQAQLELDQSYEDIAKNMMYAFSDMAISNEKDKGKAVGKVIKQTLNSVIDAYVAAEVGKATLGGFLSFGATLAAIGPIIAAGTAGKAAINALPFAKGGSFVVDKPTVLPMAGGHNALIGEAGPERVDITPLKGGSSGNGPMNINLVVELDGKVIDSRIKKVSYDYAKDKKQGIGRL